MILLSNFQVVLVLLILLFFITSCRSHTYCAHVEKETLFPPKVFHQILNRSYVNSFDEILVIGDVHGCYTEMQLLLQKSNVTSPKVLKIFAGDTLRKGPDSIKVLHFLRNTPSVIAVRGNNDQKVLEIKHKSDLFQYKIKKDDAFIKKLTQDDLDFVAQLPYTISIPSLNAIILHAGLLPGVPLQLNAPFDMMNLRDVVPDSNCLGGFRPIKSHSKGIPWASQWRGPRHVYFAHDEKLKLQVYPLATGIDTACVYGHYLTGAFIKGPRRGTLIQQRALETYFSHNPDFNAMEKLNTKRSKTNSSSPGTPKNSNSGSSLQ